MADSSRRLKNRAKLFFKHQANTNYIDSKPSTSGFDDTSSDFPKPIEIKQLEVESSDSRKLVFNSLELPVGSIKAVSEKICVARLGENKVVAFNRYCPHQGADLSGGYLRGGSIVCPWHSLLFNAESGASPCQTLSQLDIFKCLDNGEMVEIQIDIPTATEST